MDITETSLGISAAKGAAAILPVLSPAGASQFAPTGTAGPFALDRVLHAQATRLTSGLSPSSFPLACADWDVHLPNAPAHHAVRGTKAPEQWNHYTEATGAPISSIPTRRTGGSAARSGNTNPTDFFTRASCLLAADWWAETSRGGPAVGHNQQIVSFAARLWMDIVSPSNSSCPNLKIIEATATTAGKNFNDGFKNFLNAQHATLDGIPSEGQNSVLGGDLAARPGKVVFRNELIDLIQYRLSTETACPELVLVVPARIKKYDILDLSSHESLIRHLARKGYTVFVISWLSPGPELRDMGLDDYRRLGPMAALKAVDDICRTLPVHGSGSCLGGTRLLITAAAIARDQDDRLKSLTLFAVQTGFTEASELELFISEGQPDFVENMMAVRGTLDSRQMAGAFQILRSNDLVWSRLIGSHLLGRPEAESDLIASNADGTRMPARMPSESLCRLFLNNDSAVGHLDVASRPVSLSDIHLASFVLGNQPDHIAPRHSVDTPHLLSPAEITFVLTSARHNADIVSEPGHPHRSFGSEILKAGSPGQGPDEWRATAHEQDGSWWPFWVEWLGRHSVEPTKPPIIGAPRNGYTILGGAHGTYVIEH